MNNIVIAFPKKEVANSIKKILAQSGYTVMAVANTGASALSSMNGLNMGIIICGYRFSDMMYSEIYEYMPKEFQMLLIASAAGIMEKNVDNLMSLSMPLKVHELLQTVEMMDYTITRRRKKLRQRPKVPVSYTHLTLPTNAKQCKGCTDGTKWILRGGSTPVYPEAKHG